jgi:hypothetical protein
MTLYDVYECGKQRREIGILGKLFVIVLVDHLAESKCVDSSQTAVASGNMALAATVPTPSRPCQLCWPAFISRTQLDTESGLRP